MNLRRKVRESVLKGIYAHHFSGDASAEIVSKVIKPLILLNPESKKKAEVEAFDFAEKLFYRALNLSSIADNLISPKLSNWKLERLAALDRMVILLGITEFLEFEDIPTKVTINEYIEIAKKYSTYKSGKFINGILDSILKDLQKQGEIKKSAIGLLDKKV